MTNAAELTIAICTFNRAARLGGLLAEIQSLGARESEPWRLLVVDNASTDPTQDVLRSFAGRLPLDVVVETEQGIAAARSRVLDEVQTPLLVCTDDDVSLDRDWLAAWRRAFRDVPEAGWFGGRIVPTWPDGKPNWVDEERLDRLVGVFTCYQLGDRSRFYREDDPLPFGANFGVRTAFARQVGAFRRDLGVRGAERALGEETEWFRRARGTGTPGWYAHDAVVRHPCGRERLTVPAIWRYGVASGIAEVRIDPTTPAGRLARTFRLIVRSATRWVRGQGDRARQCVMKAGREAGRRREHARR